LADTPQRRDIKSILQPSLEIRPVGSVLLAHSERVLAKLGEDGVEPLRPEELKRLKDRIAQGADPDAIGANPFRPVVIGGLELNWAEFESMPLADISTRLRELEGFERMTAHIDRLAKDLGVKGISRSMLAQASWDRAYLGHIRDEALRDRYIATRLAALPNLPDRKAYGLALGLMEFQEEVID